MKRTFCLILVLLLLLAACGRKEPPPESSAPSPASPDSTSQEAPLASPSSASEEPPPESEGSGEVPVVPVPVEVDEDLKTAVEAALAQYREGTVEVSDQFPAPPEGFAFPETLDWEKLTAEMNPVTGYIRVAVPSADGSGEMKFFCSVFGAPDTDKTETLVCFILFE